MCEAKHLQQADQSKGVSCVLVGDMSGRTDVSGRTDESRHTDMSTYVDVRTNRKCVSEAQCMPCVRKYIRTYVHTYIRTYVHTYICTYVHTYVRVRIHIYVRMYVHLYIRTYVRMYVCMYVCMHMQACSNGHYVIQYVYVYILFSETESITHITECSCNPLHNVNVVTRGGLAVAGTSCNRRC